MTSGSTGSTFPKWQLALLLGAPVALTLGYLYYRQSSVEEGDAKKKGKLDSKTVSIDDGGAAESGSGDTKVVRNGTATKGGAASGDAQKEKDPLAIAVEYKNSGNEQYRAGKYDEAIVFYDKAIHNCPNTKSTDLATFYQNRAAAYEQLKNWPMVRDDCTKALDLNAKYVKAFHRRARAFEQMDDLTKALEDITATCILERFQNDSTLKVADRVLKTLGANHAKLAMTNRAPIKPSKHFVKSFLSSFTCDPIKKVVVVASSQAHGFLKAKAALDAFQFEDVVPACTDELALSEAESEYKLEALLLRATMYELTGEFEKSMEDFNAVLASTKPGTVAIKVNALVKRASIHIQMDRIEECFKDFQAAIDLDADNPDVYYHRGQMYTLLMRFDEAVADFDRTIELRPNFNLAVIQKLYVEYRNAVTKQDQGQLLCLMESFKEAIEKYHDCVECFSILAQILTEQGQYAEADQFFEKALNLDNDNATLHVHRAILILQWQSDIERGMKMLYDAIKVDDRCGFAYETLASVEVQRGHLDKAIEMFDQAIVYAKSETEIAHLYSLKDAAIAQINVSKKMGIDVSQLAALAANSM